MGILIDCLIFCFLFIPLHRGMSNWLSWIIYVLSYCIKSMVLYHNMNFSIFMVYSIMGAIIVYFLSKLADAINPLVFMFMAIFAQNFLFFIASIALRGFV